MIEINELLNEILKNISYVACVLSLLLIFQVDNMVFGIVDNVGSGKQKFEFKKFLRWFLKSFLTLLGVALLTLGVSLIPFVVGFTNIQIPTEYGDVITVTLIIVTAYSAVITEAKKAYEHFKAIMNK